VSSATAAAARRRYNQVIEAKKQRRPEMFSMINWGDFTGGLFGWLLPAVQFTGGV